MSSVYTPTSTVLHASVTLPSDGDAANAASVNTAALKYLADNAAYLNALLVPAIAQGTGTAVKVPGASVTTLVHQVGVFPNAYGSNWATVAGGATNKCYVASNDVSNPPIYFPLPFDFTSFGTIVGMSANVAAAPGHGGLPLIMPTLELVTQPSSTGVQTVLATATDASGTVAAFEAAHTISASGLSLSIGNNAYYLKVTGEQSTNALAGFAIFGLQVSVTQ